jgi:hypothetical protein
VRAPDAELPPDRRDGLDLAPVSRLRPLYDLEHAPRNGSVHVREEVPVPLASTNKEREDVPLVLEALRRGLQGRGHLDLERTGSEGVTGVEEADAKAHLRKDRASSSGGPVREPDRHRPVHSGEARKVQVILVLVGDHDGREGRKRGEV